MIPMTAAGDAPIASLRRANVLSKSVSLAVVTKPGSLSSAVELRISEQIHAVVDGSDQSRAPAGAVPSKLAIKWRV